MKSSLTLIWLATKKGSLFSRCAAIGWLLLGSFCLLEGDYITFGEDHQEYRRSGGR